MKNFALFILAASLAFSLAGCGASAGSTASSAAESAAESTAESVAESTAESVAESAAASGDEYYKYDELDYTGIYHDGNDDDVNSVEFTKNEDSTYTATISLYRLCELTGTGSIMDGAVELELTDPNGNEMTAIFYPEGEYTYAFKVTTSTWDYLPEGTEFTGFVSIENL